MQPTAHDSSNLKRAQSWRTYILGIVIYGMVYGCTQYCRADHQQTKRVDLVLTSCSADEQPPCYAGYVLDEGQDNNQYPANVSDDRDIWLDRGLMLVPLLSGLAFHAMPHYRQSLLNAPFVHGIISTILSHYLLWQRKEDPASRLLSQSPPDNIWDQLLPRISYGYAGHEIIASIRDKKPAFIIHSNAMFALFSFYAMNHQLHLLSDTLVIEMSSIFLGLKDTHEAFVLAFAGSFFLYRWGLLPCGWWRFVQQPYTEEELAEPAWLSRRNVITAAGVAFNGLSVYWGWKILQGITARYSW